MSEDLLSAFASGDFVPIPEVKNLGDSYLTFDGLLPQPGLKIYEDGGASGCGGKLWPAGDLLARYMIRRGTDDVKNILELGSGTGLTGLAIGMHEQHRDDLSIWITDIERLVPLMEKNIELNNLDKIVKARTLNWGESLPEYAAEDIDVILAADCVYLESAFPLLEKTLLDLTESKDIPIFICYKKRRRADMRFFKAMRKHFTFQEIKDHADYDLFFPQSVYLYEVHRK
ncbi:protein-lysine N-methyltransferase Efm6p [Trichomonascus vanleenenianus]|uniref:putative protein-lysine N-methyltransferase n=1 Tax=Trichomonascus vanleenenianus TaxID=2268995 RepID=UPI003ECB5DDE